MGLVVGHPPVPVGNVGIQSYQHPTSIFRKGEKMAKKRKKRYFRRAKRALQEKDRPAAIFWLRKWRHCPTFAMPVPGLDSCPPRWMVEELDKLS
ncbi:hypothetical protein COU00_04260 [Candidatus Falkowbacteria bacterium CG10_big_fil_rev_8_21_14_0_10_43_11]|uniref:Uncharacterized protein n=1 Tax=Candidatus Falkowbacteria bacterium CG10_big_fil_rev_8_21_14_0_10_43_11 TaxID=1974568 RepID=A0A2M6WL14_9BACT|nr:MAG: hypothetical protein COU00_04260 [Candidatus Falkowbacteria bacterium CG10_big_fil_rev_8_21_14_0_10_43_11]